MKIRVLTALSVAALAVAATGCAAETTTTDSGINLVNDGQLTVCTQFPYEPFEFLEGDTPMGFDMDLMRKLAEQEGLEFNVTNTSFDTIQSGAALDTGQCDIAAAAMTITEERQQSLDFTNPYFDATQALLIQDGAGYDSLESLSGQTIGVQTGTTGEIYVTENAPEDATVRKFEDIGLLTQAVAAGQVDAGVQDNAPTLVAADQNPDLEVSTEFDTGEEYGFAVAKGGNATLLEAANSMLSTAMDDGSYDDIYEEWFGAAPSS